MRLFPKRKRPHVPAQVADEMDVDPADPSVLVLKVRMSKDIGVAVGKVAFLRGVPLSTLLSEIVVESLPELLEEVKAISEAKNLPSVLP